MRLDSASLTNLCAFLDLNKRADEAFVSNLTAIEIDRLNNRDIRSKPDVDDPGGAKIWFVYERRIQK